jgi:catechol 2,3-dioxygenase-like lactoylglutathione lyase family enzyme
MVNGINHITISVSNITESFNFYNKILGLKPVMLSKYSAYLLCGTIWIALQEEKEINHSNALYTHIALNVKKRDYKKIVLKLKKLKVKEWKENNTEGESLYFLDPSGNKFEIHYSKLRNRIINGKKEWKNVVWFM